MNTNSTTTGAEVAAHTPGPWKVCDFDSRTICREGDPEAIATVHRRGGKESDATARLIAAAPELLTSLKMMTDLAKAFGVGEHCDGNILEAEAAIAKAEGRAA